MIKLASSSSISLIDAGYQGATANLEPVVCAAIVLKNAGGNFFASTQARKNLSDKRPSPRCPRRRQGFRPTVPVYQFFFLQAQLRQIAECQEHQKHMSMPAGPRSAFMVVQSQFLFQLLIALFNPESFMGEPHHLQSRDILWHVTEKVAQFTFFPAMPTPLHDQPNLFGNQALAISLGRPYPPYITET